MADKRITDLNEATSILDTDVLPIVSGDETKKVTVETLLDKVSESETISTIEHSIETVESSISTLETSIGTVEGEIDSLEIAVETKVSADSEDYTNMLSVVEAMENGNTALTTNVSVSGNWTVYNNAGTEVDLGITTTGNISIEYGYKASFSGTYAWSGSTNTKSPETITTNVNGWETNLVSGETSSTGSTDMFTSYNTAWVKLSAPKTGLVYNSSTNEVTLASGEEDTYTVSKSVSFYYKSYFITSNDISESGISAALSEAVSEGSGFSATSKSLSVNVNTYPDSYYLYAYPTSFGLLTDVKENGMSISPLPSYQVITLTTASGSTIEMYAYYNGTANGYNSGESSTGVSMTFA